MPQIVSITKKASGFFLPLLYCASNLESFLAMGMLDLRRFGGQMGCLIDSMQSFFEKSGMQAPKNLPEGISLSGKTPMPIVLYRDGAKKQRRNWTIAHELGHLTLAHTAQGEEEEREADAFAAALLMPDVLIAVWEEKNRCKMNVEELLRNFAVSRVAAERKRRDLDAYGFPTPAEASIALAKRIAEN